MLGTPAPAATDLLWLITSGRATSRMELARVLGLPQSTVSLRVQALLSAGVLTESGEGRSQGGRRPRLLAVRPEFGHVWTAEFGSSHVRVGALDLGGNLLCTTEAPITIDAHPDTVLAEFAATVHDLARRSDVPGRWLGVGVGLPGPVDYAAGTVTLPARMPGWRGYPVRAALQRHFTQPVVVDNDANLMALGAARLGPPGETLVVVKAGTGIGSGLIVEGRLHRGRGGVAGDISHVRVAAGEENPCSCGNRGCLETVASGAALIRQLREAGVELASAAEVMAAAENAHPEVTPAVRRAGLLLGEVLATVVNFANPDAVLLGGALSGAEAFVAAVRGALYERCLPLATRELRIDRVRTGADTALVGAGALTLEEVFDEAVRAAGKVAG
ncbi:MULTISPECIES: ROK family transcriptional regulator [Amycolatopsis]|uniref:Sugar kinase of the NBD/HSP70 family, may contain an N-terminal HTH domain n=2 Tax=Amycolatopsis TaxID=1813 RepID=A0A1I3LSL5_9PSEU|nr:ROK family transcriptional regulator [Amycolatopsis sacchari]SFI87721.1 Sugar kinase of the NBD/HSP70 family, may contain an N-terminal HTH domain [Amycolatopsis sacchari]